VQQHLSIKRLVPRLLSSQKSRGTNWPKEIDQQVIWCSNTNQRKDWCHDSYHRKKSWHQLTEWSTHR